jgi:RND family efflux transporter MFP subunit
MNPWKATMTTIPRTPATLLAATLLLAAAGCGEPPAEADRTATAAESLPAGTRLADAARVELPRRAALHGTVEAERTSAVSARVMAMVTAVRVQAGDTVRRGQVLLEIDPQAARGQLDQALGALAQARAGLALAERNRQRYEALAEADAASALELDMARMDHERAQGAVEQAEGAVAAARAVAADSTVTAPFAGRVVRKLAEVGDLVTPGRPLVVLESEGERRIAFPVPESLVAEAGLAPGSPLAVTIDARPDLGTLAGRVVEMTPGADPQAHAYDVEVGLAGVLVGPALPTGTSARGFVEVGHRVAVVVPARALLRRGGLDLVVVREDDGSLRTRAVTVGPPADHGRIEVLSGLAGGEQVVVGLAEAVPEAAERG